MRSLENVEPGDPPPGPLDAALRSIPDPAVPEGLLAACLATVPDVDRAEAGRLTYRRARVVRWLAAAAVMVAAIGLLARSRPADAAGVLRSVRDAWVAAPSSHRVERITTGGAVRTVETWVVRGEGVRRETRADGELIGVVVRGSRWEFRWDVRGRTVAAWSTELTTGDGRPEDRGLFLDSQELAAWAESRHASISTEPDELDGRDVRKLVVRWPGGAEDSHAEIVWFDPGTLLPVRSRAETPDGTAIETVIDYPSPDAVSRDLFRFTMPPDATLEVNDPGLGRPLYSGAREPAARTNPTISTEGVKP